MPLAPSPICASNIASVLRAVVGVIDMSDPEHPNFADSAADCLDELLRHNDQIRALLAAAISAQAQDEDARPLIIAKRDAEHGLDFWNNEDGFGRLADATVFTPAEAAEFDLPIADDEPEWLTMPIIR